MHPGNQRRVFKYSATNAHRKEYNRFKNKDMVKNKTPNVLCGKEFDGKLTLQIKNIQ